MKKVGLALGAGSFKGFAHVGILKELEKNKIPIDYIAGTSAGSIVGALYASGVSVREIERIIYKTDWKDLLDFVLPDEGFLKGDKFEGHIRKLIGNIKFKDLKVPLQIVAADLRSGKKIIFNKGDVASAARASSGLPVIFEPKKQDRMLLVDGGIVDPIPVNVVREMGADYVIACDVSNPVHEVFGESKKPSKFNKAFKKAFLEQELENVREYLNIKEKAPIVQFLFNPAKITDLFKGSNSKMKVPRFLKYNVASVHIMTNEISKYVLKEADAVIHPSFGGIYPLDTTNSKLIVKRGELAARKKIKKILREIK
tara:strand:- start:10569 stop:11507 length:939 start_codon:yes stop_codon:yes gene_type:complete